MRDPDLIAAEEALAGAVDPPALLPAQASAPASVPPPPEVPLVGQAEAIRLVEAGLRLEARLILLFGPIGCGKTTYLLNLARQGLGRYLERLDQLPERSGWIFVDLGEGSSTAELDGIATWLAADRRRGAIIALRGAPPAPRFTLQGEDVAVRMFSPPSLVEATGGRLSLALAERVQIAACLEPLGAAELQEVARRLTHGRAELDDEALSSIASAALRSGRGAHELVALLRQVPAGSWRLKPLRRERATSAG